MDDDKFFMRRVGRLEDDEEDARAVAPELLRMNGVLATCVYGEEENNSMCRMPGAKNMQVVKLPGAHHFDGDYARLATLLLSHMR